MSHQYPDPDGYWENNPGWQAAPQDSPYGPNYGSQGYYGQGGYSGAPGYGTGGYGSGGHWGPYPPPYPGHVVDRSSTIWALVIGILSSMCCAPNLVAVVFSAVALSKDREPAEMHRFTRYAWISNWAHLGLLVCFVLFVIGMGLLDSGAISS